MQPVTTAVILAAGLGTRMLPATKAVPKEMLPLVDRPLVDWCVDEAVAAGITRIVFVIAEGKESILEHFRAGAEVLKDRLLPLRNNEHNPRDPCRHRLVDAPVDQRPVHQRQHLLRHRLRRREHARPQPRRENHRRRHRLHHTPPILGRCIVTGYTEHAVLASMGSCPKLERGAF